MVGGMLGRVTPGTKLALAVALLPACSGRGGLEGPLEGTIYFVSERGDAPAVYRVRPDGSGEAPVLGGRAPSYPYGARGDGALVAFVHADQVVVAAPDGGAARALVPSAEGVSWSPVFSPDGTRVLFESSREAFRELYTVELATGALSRLTSNPEGNFDPAWSPDGARIAFASSRHGQLDLFVMRADGADQRRVTEHAGDAVEPAWAPRRCGARGDRLAYLSGRDGRDSVLVLELGDDATPVSSPLNVSGEDGVESFAWRPDGCAIAFAARAKDRRSKVRVVELPSLRVVELTRPEDSDSNPAWSPDGRHLVLARAMPAPAGAGDPGSDLFIKSADGRRERRLTRDPKGAWLPRWLAISASPAQGG